MCRHGVLSVKVGQFFSATCNAMVTRVPGAGGVLCIFLGGGVPLDSETRLDNENPYPIPDLLLLELYHYFVAFLMEKPSVNNVVAMILFLFRGPSFFFRVSIPILNLILYTNDQFPSK